MVFLLEGHVIFQSLSKLSVSERYEKSMAKIWAVPKKSPLNVSHYDIFHIRRVGMVLLSVGITFSLGLSNVSSYRSETFDFWSLVLLFFFSCQIFGMVLVFKKNLSFLRWIYLGFNPHVTSQEQDIIKRIAYLYPASHSLIIHYLTHNQTGLFGIQGYDHLLRSLAQTQNLEKKLKKRFSFVPKRLSKVKTLNQDNLMVSLSNMASLLYQKKFLSKATPLVSQPNSIRRL